MDQQRSSSCGHPTTHLRQAAAYLELPTTVKQPLLQRPPSCLRSPSLHSATKLVSCEEKYLESDAKVLNQVDLRLNEKKLVDDEVRAIEVDKIDDDDGLHDSTISSRAYSKRITNGYEAYGKPFLDVEFEGLKLTNFALSLNSITTDKHALISFKNSITSDPYAILSANWSQNNTSVCNWIGVSCGLKHGRVTALNLSGYGLVGTVAPHLGNLTFLRYLDISFNNFSGFLPFELSKLRHLKVMNVGANSFTGEIPTWLGSLPRLEKLYLYKNTFLGTIPSSLSNNTKNQMLQILNLNYNQLSGSIPYAIFNVSSLREIRIRNNSLSGWLPSEMCDNLPNIEALDISANQLSGEIPPNIWKCRHLQELKLSTNHFNGKIPSEIGSLSRLKELYLGVNDFRGKRISI
ncbi:hypothetical protein SASPL_150129 [Salvia splendens]|uniref:Leucine-rich repeat-containing N-terminal plant-type domain-containing protein n=1 Tax=Salvia splendens TaxID=180675 RepID=A0A8X8Z2K3_SALSN|nr:hypothetical protein SASPL_150129 [Salvia splendens]